MRLLHTAASNATKKKEEEERVPYALCLEDINHLLQYYISSWKPSTIRQPSCVRACTYKGASDVEEEEEITNYLTVTTRLRQKQQQQQQQREKEGSRCQPTNNNNARDAIETTITVTL